MIREFLKEISGIYFIDIGSSGNLDVKWDTLKPFIHLIGFDPNKEECDRMSYLPNNFLSLTYLPFAIAGKSGKHILYKTKNIYCYSLLKPNSEWLSRFSFSSLFEKEGEEEIDAIELCRVDLVQNRDSDIIKVDTQGLELPVLQNAGAALENSFLVETETGFVENYVGETTYAEIDLFMRSKGFLLFDINTNHRIPRNNHFKEDPTGAEQILWCEATWMKDYLSLSKKGTLDYSKIDREKALKILIICAIQRCIDYGYELAVFFKHLNLINANELKSLENKNAWLITNDLKSKESESNLKEREDSLISTILRLLPLSLRMKISDQAQLAVKQKHIFRS